MVVFGQFGKGLEFGLILRFQCRCPKSRTVRLTVCFHSVDKENCP